MTFSFKADFEVVVRNTLLFGGLHCLGVSRAHSNDDDHDLCREGWEKLLLGDRLCMYNNNKADSFVNANVPAPGQAADGYCVRDDCDFRSRNQSPIVLRASERHVAVRLGGTRFVLNNNNNRILSRGTSLWFWDLEISAKSELDVVCTSLNSSLNLLRLCFTHRDYLDVNGKTLVLHLKTVHFVLYRAKKKMLKILTMFRFVFMPCIL